jgi:hypothetical protein
MARTTIKDNRLRIIGYIEDIAGGRQRALDSGLRLLGYYEPVRDQTLDAGLHIVSTGNTLSGLIYAAA